MTGQVDAFDDEDGDERTPIEHRIDMLRGMAKNIEARQRWREPQDGSDLDGDEQILMGTGLLSDDNMWTSPLSIRHEIDLLTFILIDTMRSLADSLERRTQFAQLSLVRAIIEATCNVAYLVGPETRSDRLLRLAQMSVHSAMQYDKVSDSVSMPTISADRRLQARILEEEVGGKGFLNPGPGHERRVRSGAQFLTQNSLLVVLQWNAASGVAHGQRDWLMIMGERDNSTKVREDWLADMVGMAAGLTYEMQWLLRRRCVPPGELAGVWWNFPTGDEEADGRVVFHKLRMKARISRKLVLNRLVLKREAEG